MGEIRIEDVIKAFEKLKLNRIEGEVRLLGDPWEGRVVPEQEEYQEGMVDRKADVLPLWMWDGIDDE